VTGLLREVRDDLDDLLAALESGSRPALGRILGRGVAGTTAIPSKHGLPAVEVEAVFVRVADHPGWLAHR
jgi:prephenate dehydrogenase